MLRYFRTFLFGLALVLSMTQVPAVTMGQTNSHQMMDHAAHNASMFVDGTVSVMTDGMTHSVVVQETECTESASCVHCATNMACMNHCAASVGVPSFPISRVPASLSDEYLVTLLSVSASFVNQPSTPPPKVISFS